MLFPFGFLQSQSSFDPDAASFFARVTAAGGTLSATEKTAVNTLVVQMKADGTWTPMKAIYPMVGASAAACAQNLKSSSFTGTFTSGWTFASTGVTPNGTSAYMDTTFVPNTFSTNNAHLSFYSRTNLATGTRWDIGSLSSDPTNNPEFSLTFANSFESNKMWGSLGNYNQSASLSVGIYTGFGNINRTSSSVLTLFRNGSLLNTNATPNVLTNDTNPIYIGASNLGGTAQRFSNRECAFSSIGDGLTNTQASNFYTAVQTFNQTLNRQVGAQIVSDADAQAYINRVYTAGGTLTNTEANAVNQLTIDMKAAGIWTAMKAVYPMVGSSAAACAQNLKSSSFTGTFSSGWTFASTGVTGNGTSAYMDTALNISTQLTLNTNSASGYYRTNVIKNASSGAYVSTNNCFYFGTRYTGSVFYAGSQQEGTSLLTGANLDSTGFYQLNRNAINSVKLFKNNTTIASSTASNTGALPNFNFLLSALNGSTISDYDNKECAFSSISDGLTDTQASNFYTAVQTFQTTLSRQV
jgi:hypothetical protein